MKKSKLWPSAFVVVVLVVAVAPVVGQASGQGYPAAEPAGPAAIESLWLLGQIDTPGLAKGLDVEGQYAYIADYYTLRIVDVSDPAAPFEVGFFQYQGATVYLSDVEVVGNLAYIAAGAYGNLLIVDVSNPAVPELRGMVTTALGAPTRVAVAGGYAYTAGGEDFSVVDVSNPAAPTRVSWLDIRCGGVVVVGGTAYVARTTTTGAGGLYVVDVSNPYDPQQLGFYETTKPSWELAVQGSYAYLTADSEGLRVVDVSTPAAPTEVGYLKTASYDDAQGVAVEGTCAYVAAWTRGLYLVDVSTPAAPQLMGIYSTPTHAADVMVVDGLAYLIDEYLGLIILRAGFSISGWVTDTGGNPVEGVTITATGGHTAVTDASGNYTLIDLAPGTYTLTAAKAGYGFDPASREAAVPPDATAQSFTATPCPSPLTGVTVSGPESGTVGVAYDLTGAITPLDATAPVAYSWSPEPGAGQGTSTATYTFGAPGVYATTLTAQNCGGSASDTVYTVIGGGGDAASTVSYQGQVVVGGSAFSGTGYFKFAVVDSLDPPTSHWSNDGTSAGGSEPAGAVALTVSQGLFSVLLGDTALGMAALPASAFSGADRRLRAWFSSDGETFQLLSPDGRIAAVPYALQASNAGMLEGLEGSAYQLRVSGACGEGYAIRAVAADGTVTCEAVGGAADWSLRGNAGSGLAEALPVAGDPAGYQPGDVLVISLDRPGGVEKCSQAYDGRVLGVYSTRPGFPGADKGGGSQAAAGDVPVAVLGIVPVKVSAENGPIQPGDLLTTSSTPGHAMRCEGLEVCFGRTLGKALEALAAGQRTGIIRMLVTLQ